MAFKPTDQQASALEVIGKRLDARMPETRLFGYAGTGKTTIAKYIAEQEPGNVFFAAYTGKAASVLTRKGCAASTIHSLIYRPVGDRASQLEDLMNKYDAIEDAESDEALQLWDAIETIRPMIGKPGFQLNGESSLREADLLIVDEVSMVDKNLAEDLLSFDVPIIALGDPAQLPPVGGGGYFTKGGEGVADAMLTDVQRQAADSEVIRLATWVRENQTRPPYKAGTVVRRIGQSDALSYDQILVGTNKTRRDKNNKMRKLKGFDTNEILNPGEKIIVLENNKDHKVLNGQQFYVIDLREIDKPGLLQAYLVCDCAGEGAYKPGQSDPWAVQCTVCGWLPNWVPMWIHGFMGEKGEDKLKLMPFHKKRGAVCATFGYAITVHKAQGSEWNSVLVIDESHVFRKDSWRWLYTAVTRAAEKVTIVR